MANAYEQVTRQKVVDLKASMDVGFGHIVKRLDKIDVTNKELFNHMSDRPTKAAARNMNIMVAIMSSLMGVAGTFILAIKLA